MARRSRRAPEQPAAAASGSRDRPRTRPARRREEGLLERYRTLIITGLGVTGLLIVGVFIFQGGARAAYECASLLTPAPAETVTPRPPTPSPELTPSPEPTQTPGSAQTPAAGTPDPDATPSPEPTQTPEPTPEPEPTPRLGFPTADMGRRHVRDPGQTLRYSFCPPTSGDHFAITGRGVTVSAGAGVSSDAHS